MSKTKKICISGIVIAMYIVIMFVNQSFASQAVQVRIATVVYSFSYIFPFLVVPIGIANALSNLMMGGLGALDVVGGFIAGVIVSGMVYLVRRYKLSMILIIPIIVLGNGLIVPIWLSYLLGMPYWALVLNVSLGQIPSGIASYFLMKVLKKHMALLEGYENDEEKRDDCYKSQSDIAEK